MRRQKKEFPRTDEFKDFIKNILVVAVTTDEKKINTIITKDEYFKIFEEAFTSKDYNDKNNYERYEKIGDAIFDAGLIKYISSEYFRLYNSYISNGQMAYTKDWFKSNYRMMEYADRWEFQKYILGYDRKKSKMLSDVFEAFVGAIDAVFCKLEESEMAGFRYTNNLIKYIFSDKFSNGEFAIFFGDPDYYKEPVTIINEVLKNDLKYDVFMSDPKIPSEKGMYTIKMVITGKDFKKTYEATSEIRREAKTAVAQQVISDMKINYSTIMKEKRKVPPGEFHRQGDEWKIDVNGKEYSYKDMTLEKAELENLIEIT